MQMSQFEKPITTPEISQESTASQNNDDIFDHSDPKQDTPITDPGLEQELHILQDLKEAQLNVTDSSESSTLSISALKVKKKKNSLSEGSAASFSNSTASVINSSIF